MTPVAPAGFLRLRRQRLTLVGPDGHVSEPFLFDRVEREALDAVVVVPHYRDESGAPWVYLRSSVRPALALRGLDQRPLPEKDTLGSLWELPAGLVEPPECHAEGLRTCARRELMEEIGFDVPEAGIEPLGPASFPAAGVIGERHHFFRVEVRPATRMPPSEDGSVLEQGALVVAVRLADALATLGTGQIEDAKSEIGLRRFADWVVASQGDFR